MDLVIFKNSKPISDPFKAANVRARRAMLKLIRGGKN